VELATQNKKPMITPKEKEILQLIADGLSSKQIAERLSISFYTVQTHRKNMLAKMGVKNTPALIVKILSLAA
jgi:DNA-binding CsgD family transcriptional regulator